MTKDGNRNDLRNKEDSKERTSKLNEDLVHSKVRRNFKIGFENLIPFLVILI